MISGVEMLDQRRMGALDQQGQRRRPTSCPPGKRIDSGERDLGVALADDLGPAADDRALDEAEALERHAADVADEVAGRARTAAARRISSA